MIRLHAIQNDSVSWGKARERAHFLVILFAEGFSSGGEVPRFKIWTTASSTSSKQSVFLLFNNQV